MIYDTKTKNLSFLKMSYHLKAQGVKNNKFMLALYDESLSGVDVYSPNLTIEQKAKIFAECCRNWWYFIREVEKIPQTGGSDGGLFELNIGNMAAGYCCINNINHLFMVPRQIGKTVLEVSFSLWVYAFSGSYNTETYIHKAQSGSIDNLGRLKKYKQLMPKWLQEMIDDHQDKDNLEEKFSFKRKNQIIGLSSAHNDASAEKLGRGSSTAMVYFDEFAFLERNALVWRALVPAWKTSADVARSNNAPYGIRITTTPNNLSLPQAAFCYNQIKEPACRFTYAFYDIPTENLHKYVYDNSGNDFVFIQYTWQECGKSPEWYSDQCRLIGDKTTIKRELENVWPESSDGNVFNEEQLDKIKYFVKPIQSQLDIDGYQILFFEKPDFLMNYIFSCDVSGGLSQDRSVITIIHPGDFHVVGLFANSRIDTDAFRRLLRTLLTQYFIHAILNIENNSYGLAILDTLMKDPAIEPRMYKEYMVKQGEKTLRDGTVVKNKTKKLVYGTNTNSASRKLMMEMLPSIVDDEPEVFVSEMFYEEVKNLCQVKNKVEARPGFHDDIIMSYLITRYSLAYGNCFKNVFHILGVPTKANIRTGEGSNMGNAGNMNVILNNIESSSYSIDDSSEIYGYINDMTAKNEAYPGHTLTERDKKGHSSMRSLISKLNDFD